MTPPTPPRVRRSELTCPAHSPRMMASAARSDADEVILDLEDACAVSQKVVARGTLIEALRSLDFGDKVRAFRCNGVRTAYFEEDIRQVVAGAGSRLDSLVLPKVDGAEDVRTVDRLLSEVEAAAGLPPGRIELEVLIESARGLLRAEEIADASPRLRSLIFGIADFAADVGAKEIRQDSFQRFHYPRSRLLIVARAYGLLAIDSVTIQLRDLAQVRADADAGAQMGFDGKWAIHPSHLEPIHAAYTPAREELERAVALLKAYDAADRTEGKGAIVVGDEMIDAAGIRMERRKVAIGLKAGLLSAVELGGAWRDST